MSRQRMIRPEFFVDAELADLPPITRLLFIGLWTLADREGRLRDRPRMIKLAVLPADKANVEEMLEALVGIGCIRRYEVEGARYIDIPGFITYQRIHPREAQSDLPPFKASRAKKVPISGEAVDLHGEPRLYTASREKVSSLDVDVDVVLQELQEHRDCGLEDEVLGTAEPRALGVPFDEFWAAYPNRSAKALARDRWSKIGPADQEMAMATAEAMKQSVDRGYREARFCPHAATFLNQRRWEDWADGPPPGYAPECAPAPRRERSSEDQRPACVLCGKPIAAEQFERAAYMDGKGWRHRSGDCPPGGNGKHDIAPVRLKRML